MIGIGKDKAICGIANTSEYYEIDLRNKSKKLIMEGRDNKLYSYLSCWGKSGKFLAFRFSKTELKLSEGKYFWQIQNWKGPSFQ